MHLLGAFSLDHSMGAGKQAFTGNLRHCRRLPRSMHEETTKDVRQLCLPQRRAAHWKVLLEICCSWVRSRVATHGRAGEASVPRACCAKNLFPPPPVQHLVRNQLTVAAARPDFCANAGLNTHACLAPDASPPSFLGHHCKRHQRCEN